MATLLADNIAFAATGFVSGLRNNNVSSFSSIAATSDGGFVVAADKNIIKYNSAGSVVWTTNISAAADSDSKVAVLTNGNIIVRIRASGSRSCFVKLSATGSITTAEIPLPGEYYGEYINGFAATSDGGFVGSGKHGEQGFIIKYNSSESVVWTLLGGGTDGNTHFDAITETSDGGYAVVGWSDKASTTPAWPNSGNGRLIIAAKCTSAGVWSWGRSAGTAADLIFNYGMAVAATSGGGFVAVGHAGSSSYAPSWGHNGDQDAVIIAYSSSGTVSWAKNAGGSGYDIYEGVSVASDGSIIAVGRSDKSSVGTPAWDIQSNSNYAGIVVRYSSSGSVQWSMATSTYYHTMFGSVAILSSGEAVVAGSSADAFNYSDDDGYHDIWPRNGSTANGVFAKIGESQSPVGTPGNITYSNLQWESTLSAPTAPTGATRSFWQYKTSSTGTWNDTTSTATTYTPSAAQIGYYFRVSYTVDSGYTGGDTNGRVYTAQVGPITVKSLSSPGSAPSGSTIPGYKLTAPEITGATYTLQWYRGSSTPITNATGSDYTLTSSDIGYQIRVQYTGTGNYSGTVYSSYTYTVSQIPVGESSSYTPVLPSTTTTVGDFS
ncbi:MAG: hypothetical protein LBL34_01495 [Clostridiales bacterium]|nr:hypothetical protein [Clostridiales bacterium]